MKISVISNNFRAWNSSSNPSAGYPYPFARAKSERARRKNAKSGIRHLYCDNVYIIIQAFIIIIIIIQATNNVSETFSDAFLQK